MSYVVLVMYSFTCDALVADGTECLEMLDCSPAADAGQKLIREAHRLMRAEGWTVRKTEGGWQHFCPAHTPRAAGIEREQAAVSDHACPRCHAETGERCRAVDSSCRVLIHPHPERVALAKGEA